MRKALCTIALCLGLGTVVHSQTCSPFMGIGTYQAFDNNGNVATNAVIYSFQAGTSTQQATFSDSACSVPNVNPITLGSGARVTIWLTTANTYKFVLCLQNDGSSCSASDVLFSVDQVPGGVTGGGGGGGGAPFIDNAANPATSGLLRLASGSSVCWRNVANSANLCFKKDVNDLLSWDGGSFKLPEVAAPTSVSGFDILYADSTAHRYKQCSNGSACAQIVNAGNDIGTTDNVTGVHFGATQETFGATAPTSGQLLQFNGTNIVGFNTPDATMGTVLNMSGGAAVCAAGVSCNTYIFPNTHTLVRILANVLTAPSGCTTNATFGVRDITAGSNLATITPTATGFLDSGALSVSIPATHTIGLGLTVLSSGCTTNTVLNLSAVYE